MAARRMPARAAIALAAACAHAPPPPLHSTPLVVQRAGWRGVVPLVQAKVAGQPVMFVLDTGANRSMLPERFAQEHHLVRATAGHDVLVVDANGQRVRMQMAQDVPIQFEGENAAGKLDFLLNPTRGTNDLGILAPSDIVSSGGALVIDLENETLRYEPEEAALERLRRELPVPLRDLDASRCLEEGFFQHFHRIVRATVNGVETKMMVDTGASVTMLARNNPAIPSMLQMRGNRETVAAIASQGQTFFLKNVPIVVAGTPFVLPVVVEPASQTCGHGVLGTDVLRHCVLVWGESSLWAACHPAKMHGTDSSASPR